MEHRATQMGWVLHYVWEYLSFPKTVKHTVLQEPLIFKTSNTCLSEQLSRTAWIPAITGCCHQHCSILCLKLDAQRFRISCNSSWETHRDLTETYRCKSYKGFKFICNTLKEQLFRSEAFFSELLDLMVGPRLTISLTHRSMKRNTHTKQSHDSHAILSPVFLAFQLSFALKGRARGWYAGFLMMYVSTQTGQAPGCAKSQWGLSGFWPPQPDVFATKQGVAMISSED